MRGWGDAVSGNAGSLRLKVFLATAILIAGALAVYFYVPIIRCRRCHGKGVLEGFDRMKNPIQFPCDLCEGDGRILWPRARIYWESN